MSEKAFKDGFIWSVATASAQVEGASKADGKGLSNWDVYPTINQTVYQNQSPNDGCDHYYHLDEDIALLKELGVQAYRFSFAWTRIFPNGVGQINEKGLAFYDRLLEELEKNHIQPFATIFHWDFPYELIKKGGWLNEDSPKWFFQYAKVLIDRYKDRIKYWIPINEPPCVADMGGTILRANYSTKEKLQIVHNILLAHGYAAKYIKDKGGFVGTALCASLYAPQDENNQDDINAARNLTFELEKDSYWRVSIWADPIVFGKYPDKYYELYDEDTRPNITKEDMELISTPIDFIGLNVYTGDPVNGKGQIVNHPIGNAKTTMDWNVYPRIIYWSVKFMDERYKKPFYITENGCAVTDLVTEDNQIHDGARIEYLKQHLKYLRKAYQDGVDLRGYTLWSFMDNFEWFKGYSQRFGIVYVDYQNKKRIKKDSFEFYKTTIKENGKNI